MVGDTAGSLTCPCYVDLSGTNRISLVNVCALAIKLPVERRLVPSVRVRVLCKPLVSDINTNQAVKSVCFRRLCCCLYTCRKRIGKMRHSALVLFYILTYNKVSLALAKPWNVRSGNIAEANEAIC
jgi:hypothetical protein